MKNVLSLSALLEQFFSIQHETSLKKDSFVQKQSGLMQFADLIALVAQSFCLELAAGSEVKEDRHIRRR